MSRCNLEIFDDYVPQEVEEACVGWDPGAGMFYSQVLEVDGDEPFVCVISSDANEVIDSVALYVKPFDRDYLLSQLLADKEAGSERNYGIEQQDVES